MGQNKVKKIWDSLMELTLIKYLIQLWSIIIKNIKIIYHNIIFKKNLKFLIKTLNE